MARRAKIADRNMASIRKWAQAGATQKEIAARLHVGTATLERYLRKKEYRHEYDAAMAELRISLREKQVELAHNGDRTMLVWLGKQLLSQKDRLEQSGTGKDGAIQIETNVRDEKLAQYTYEQLCADAQKLKSALDRGPETPEGSSGEASSDRSGDPVSQHPSDQ